MTGFAMSFAAVLMLAFAFFVLADLTPSVTPLVSLATITTVTVMFSLINQLKLGVMVCYGMSFVLFARALIHSLGDIKDKIRHFISFGNVLFVASSLFVLYILRVKQPVMYQWDEFSFWGTAAKLVKNHDAIYTFYKSSMLGNSIPPALAVLSYIFQWTAPDFCEWLCFAAYDVMFFAVFAAATSVFDWVKDYLARFVFVTCLLLPYFFYVTTRSGSLVPVYISAYSDIPLALLFTGAVAVYFSSWLQDKRTILPVVPVIAMLTFSKDMGFALSCIAIFIIFFDLVVYRKEFAFLRVKGLAGKISAALLMLATTVGSFVIWSVHLGRVLEVDRTDFGGSEGMGMAQMMINGVKQLLIPSQRSEKFSAVMGSMVSAFFKTKVCMIGSGVVIVGLITAIFAMAFLFGNGLQKKRSIVMYLTSRIGFVGYYVFHLFLYVFVFRDDAYTLASYNRYMYVYYMGWFVFALLCLCKSAAEKSSFASVCSVMAILVLVSACCVRYLKPENTFLRAGQNNYTIRNQVDENVRFLGDAIKNDDVILVYNNTDSGYTWFAYTFALIDNYIVQEPYIEVDSRLTEEQQVAEYQKKLSEFMQKKGVTKVIIDYSDMEFDNKYSSCFDVHPGNFGLGTVGIYDVQYTQDGFACRLVKGTGF